MSGRLATQAIAARLATVVAPANVWDTLDDAIDPVAFGNRFKSTNGYLHCWEVTRVGSEPVETETASSITRREKVVARGYYGYKSGVSDAAFQQIVDSAIAAFDPPNSRIRQFLDLPNGAAYGIEYCSAPAVSGPQPARLSNFLVHLVELTFYVSFDPIF